MIPLSSTCSLSGASPQRADRSSSLRHKCDWQLNHQDLIGLSCQSVCALCDSLAHYPWKDEVDWDDLWPENLAPAIAVFEDIDATNVRKLASRNSRASLSTLRHLLKSIVTFPGSLEGAISEGSEEMVDWFRLLPTEALISSWRLSSVYRREHRWWMGELLFPYPRLTEDSYWSIAPPRPC